MPDYTKIASYVRNRLNESGACRLKVNKHTVHIAKTSLFGDNLPGLLVASHKRASLVIEPSTPLNSPVFVAAGFDLQSARKLVSIFDALRGKQRVLGETTNE